MNVQEENTQVIAVLTSEKIESFQKIAIDFFRSNGRDFPWRKTKNPWKILLSEILLRKTSAIQVVQVYEEISNLSPLELANTPDEKLSNLLIHLGMQNERARLLKIISRKIEESGIESLRNVSFLNSLPGVGPYARNAVLCFAYNQPLPTLDRNMIRIIDRSLSIKSAKKRPHTDRNLWKIAGLLVPIDNCKEYNWGILDLSALVCRPEKPKCDVCELNKICDYWELK